MDVIPDELLERTLLDPDLRTEYQATRPPYYIRWQALPGAGVSWTEHKLSFHTILIRASNMLFQEYGELKCPIPIYASLKVLSILEDLPSFTPHKSNVLGVFRGVISGRWAVFAIRDQSVIPDRHALLSTEPGKSVRIEVLDRQQL